MPAKRQPINKEYSKKLKAIRSFVDFDYDLRKPLHPNSKAKINKYFEAINAIEARPNKVYRSKNKKRVKDVQEFGRNGFEKLPGIKVAFYESTAANPIKLRFDKKGIHAHGEFFDIRYVPFHLQKLLDNPEKEIDRALNSDGSKGAKFFRVAVGDGGQYSIASPASRDQVQNVVGDLMKKYVKNDSDGKPKNNYWGNWLHGLLPMTARNQTEVLTFMKKEGKIRDAHKLKRRKAKRNEKVQRMRQRNRPV